MSLKSINDKAGPLATLVRKLVEKINSDANWDAGAESYILRLLADHGLSGGTCPDTQANQDRVTALAGSVPVPSDAEIDAAGGNLLDATDRSNLRTIIRTAAARKYVNGKASAAMPQNDV